MEMPVWFQNSLRKAFFDKNIYGIKIMNKTWFNYYRG